MKNETFLNTGVIITGTGRSGTTLLWQILNAHSKLRIAYEPFSSGLDIRNFSSFNGIKQPSFHWSFVKHFADKWIFLKRDTLDVLYSLIVRNKNEYKDILPFYNKIKEVNHQIDWFVTKKRRQCLIVQYKDLCLNTKNEIKKVCNFLCVKFEKNILIDYKNNKPPAWAKSAQYKFDKIIYQTNKYKSDIKFLKEIKKLGVK